MRQHCGFWEIPLDWEIVLEKNFSVLKKPPSKNIFMYTPEVRRPYATDTSSFSAGKSNKWKKSLRVRKIDQNTDECCTQLSRPMFRLKAHFIRIKRRKCHRTNFERGRRTQDTRDIECRRNDWIDRRTSDVCTVQTVLYVYNSLCQTDVAARENTIAYIYLTGGWPRIIA